MTSATQTPETTGLRRPQLERPVAMRLAATEYARFADVLEGLDDSQLAMPTDCVGWDVKDVACHVLGMAEFSASVREGIRQQRAARKRGGVFIDALTDLQVQEHRGLSPSELERKVREVGPRAARGRRRTPGFVRRRRVPEPQTVGGAVEWWALGYLIDVILTRDVWMHRVDVTRATGRPMELSAEHDGVLIADVVAEWMSRHGQACTLHLTGPAGGTWSQASGGPALELDPVEFGRILSGRATGEGPLAVQVPF